MIGPCFPRFSIINSANLSLPMMVTGRMGETGGSCATGYDRQTLVRSVGEALERQISFSKMSPAKFKCRLNELNDELTLWFRILFSAFNQEDLEDHFFECIEVQSKRYNKRVVVPSIPFTLSPHADARFMPSRDSSGCAIHPDPDIALQTAMSELAERQALTLFWYYGHLNHTTEITLQTTNEWNDEALSRIIRWFLNTKSVRIFLFDISLIKPYRSILAVYVNKNGPVHFAAGGSANIDIRIAVNKAVIELYQAFVLTYQSLASNGTQRNLDMSTDSITQGYLQFNTARWANEFIALAISKEVNISTFFNILNWKTNCQLLNILIYQKLLSFGPNQTPLAYVSTMGIPGFPLMTISKKASDAEHSAAMHYGYHHQLRFGAVPFA